MHHWRGSVYKLHIYRRPLLDDYKKGIKINDLQLIMCGDMFKDSNSYLNSRGSIEDFVSFRKMITSQLLYLRESSYETLFVLSSSNRNEHEEENKTKEGEQVYGLMAGFKSDFADHVGFKEYIGSDEVCDLSTPSVFDPKPENREVKSLYERFVKAGRMHAVPPPITGTFMPTSYKSDLEETQATFGSKSNTSSINTSDSNDFVSYDNSDKNSSASTSAGRSIPAASRNRPASIHAGRHIPAGNKEKLHDFVQVKGGTVTFEGGDGKITGKGTIRTFKLNFENVYYVEELQHFNLFSISQICDKKNKVLFIDDDAREIWLAVKARFGGNEKSKKIRKTMLKQAFSEFNVSKEEGLHKGYDSTIVAPTHSVFIVAASTNTKMVYYDQPSYSSSISYTPAPSGSIIEDVLHSFVAKNEPTQQLAYEDFEPVDQLQMEELDIKWQMAMLSLSINKFQKKAGRKINFYNKDSARFDRRKARCYNCLQLVHFTRECNVKKVDEKAMYSAFKISETKEAEQVYGLMAGFESDFAVYAGNAAVGVNPAAAEFTMMGISPKDCHMYDTVDNVPFVISKVASVPAGSRNSSASTSAGRSIPAASRNRSTSFHVGSSIPSASRNRSASIHAGRSIPAASRNRSASIHTDRSIPAASRNRSAFIHADRSILAASRNISASIHADRSIPAGRINKPTPFLAGSSVPTVWTNPVARPFFGPANLYFDNVYWPGIYDHMSMNEGRWGSAVKSSAGKLKSVMTWKHDRNKEKLDDFVQVKGGTVTFGGRDGTKDETFYILKDVIALIENQLNKKIKAIRCDNGTEFQNAKLIALCGEKGIKRDYSNARTPQQNKIEAVSTACYVLNRVSITNPHNKTPYELLSGKGKLMTVFLLGMLLIGLGQEWYFDLDYLKDSLGYTRFKTNPPAGTHDTNIITGTQANDSESECDEQVILVPSFPSNSFSGPTVHDVSAPMESNLDYPEELSRPQRQEYEAHSAIAKHGFEFFDD
nr:ribonuclease H-like domain-containing protein [Tanacetum cinerariifolium]